MNFKRFISGISALAIAATAFASMAITASAEDTVVSVDPTIDGSIVAANDTVVASTDFDSEELSFKNWYLGGGKFGSVGLMKFDIASAKAQNPDKIIKKVELVIDAKSANGNPAISIVSVDLGDWQTSDADWQKVSAATGTKKLSDKAIAQARLGSNYKSWTLDVTKAFTGDNVKDIVTLAMDASSDTQMNVASMESTSHAKPKLNITFSDKEPVNSITVEYKTADSTPVKTVKADASGLFVSEPYTCTAANYVQDESGNYYYVAGDYKSDTTWGTGAGANKALVQQVYLTKETVITYTVTPASDVVYYAEAETIFNAQGSNWSDTSRWAASEGKICSGNADGLEFYTIPATGEYQVVIVKKGNNRSTSVYSSLEEAQQGDHTSDSSSNYVVRCASGENSVYGYVYAGTKNLNEGDKLYLRGFGGDSAKRQVTTDDIDYIVVRQLSVTEPEPETEQKAFTFTRSLNSVVNKTISITVDGTTKTGVLSEEELSTHLEGDGDLMLAIIINNIPKGAESVTATILD